MPISLSRAIRRAIPALPACLALVIAATAAAQQSDDDWLERCRRQSHDDDRAHACEVRHTGLAATGAVQVNGGTDGGASVRSWDRDSIDISARIQTSAESDERARELARDIRIVTTDGHIRAEGPDLQEHDESWSVVFMLSVPRHTDVDVTAVNGPVSVRGVTGRMSLQTTNGPVALSEVGGDVTARTTNGPVVVRLAGDRWDGNGLDAETTNGPVVLRIPENYSAQLDVGTSNGPLVLGIPITVQGRIHSHVTTQLGSGGASIRVMTTNGPLRLERASTGQEGGEE